MPHEVFLSYSTKDAAATEAVCRFLEEKGVRCWMAPRDIPVGHDWAEAIIGALNRCPVMVLIYSSNANASMQVTREVQRAFEKGLAVFPFRIEAVEPNPGLEYYLGSVHWLDALTPPLEAHMGKLSAEVGKALRRHAEGGSAMTPAPVSGAPRRQPAAPPRASRSGKKVAAALAAFLVAGGVAWWIASGDEDASQWNITISSTPPAKETPAPSPAADEPPATVAVVEATPVPEPSPQPTPPPPPAAATPAEASRELPWRDSLGRAYLPVSGTEVLFALWPTRVDDYELFARATGTEWPQAGFDQGPDHPAVNVTWNDAQAFCEWFTEQEQEAGRLPEGYRYRLPTEAEWDRAVGLDPSQKTGESEMSYPWGNQWPPPPDAGNYAASLESDPFAHTSPVASFAPNRFGLFDMGGNVWQWCAEEPGPEYRTARGGSWKSGTPRELALKEARLQVAAVYRNPGFGFRCVLAPAP
ncbi:MAG TPA: SUMF1/EgtB/PvdO family nonheme iron enzyme [Chthoniobacteraceae bacterium]|nr:SUMF1/EgtB/PvdO family nonheme iron enzyme [Chthoniobacteraceae bacterium]